MSDNGFQGLHAELSERIIKVFYRVANDLGFGFMEAVYRRSMVLALREEGLAVQEEAPISVSYRGQSVGTFYADIVVEGSVILELKTADQITKQFEAQLLHYLRSTPVEVGLILNFSERATFRRVTFTNDRKPNLNHPS